MKKKVLQQISKGLLLGLLLPIAAASGQYVRMAPPPPAMERPSPAPGRGYTWVPGYQRWDGQRYIWAGGRWVMPPRPAAVWIPGRWNRSPYGWRWIPGHWRG